jgi:PIN domain nuclease of toxin-antitoxin system
MIVLDTQILVWMNLAPEKLTKKATEAMAEAGTLVIPSISLWEISMLVHYGRLELPCSPLDWLNAVLGLARVHLQDITPRIAVLSGSANMHGDPADRLVMATAKALECPLITADRKIHSLGLVSIIW